MAFNLRAFFERYFCISILATFTIILGSQPVYAESIYGVYKLGNVEWVWINGLKFDIKNCDEKMQLKKFVASDMHKLHSSVPLPSGYIPIEQVTLEALTAQMECSTFQKFNKWIKR